MNHTSYAEHVAMVAAPRTACAVDGRRTASVVDGERYLGGRLLATKANMAFP